MFDAASEWTVEIKPREFEAIRSFAYKTFGLDLRQGKERLVSARLGKQMRAGGFRTFDEYFRHVESDRSGSALTALIDALTTNHTSFLREPEHFRFLVSQILPQLPPRGEIAVWSAASSTGEEPYSILFTLLSSAPGRNVRVLATDISTRVLAAAREGRYAPDRLATLPSDWLKKYFQRVPGSAEQQVKPEYRQLIEYRRLNLIEPLNIGQRFPVVFCRNVMIYFNKSTQSALVNRLAQCIEPGGYLLVGHAESLTGIDHPLKYVQPAVYRKPA